MTAVAKEKKSGQVAIGKAATGEKGKRAAPKDKPTVTRKRKKSAAADGGASTDTVSQAAQVSPLPAYRLRQQLIERLLDAAFCELLESGGGDDHVGRSLYLHMIAQVFLALDGLSQAVPIDDLVKLSKVVAEQRRAEASSRKVEQGVSPAQGDRKRRGIKSRPTDADDFDIRRLPPNFGETVRQIYGTSFAGDVQSKKTMNDER